MAWFFLGVAILLELAGTTSLKLSDGFSRLLPSLAVAVSYTTSFFFLGLALKRIDVGVAYAIWSGVGTAAIALVGWALFAEPMGAAKVACILLIVAGVIGLRLVGG